MQQIITVWAKLDRKKQAVILFATLAILAAFVAMSRMVASPSMQLLYAGLEAGAAGDVVRALDQRGTAYEVRGGAIYVPAAQRDELRMTLAGEGLPANGGRGYELLDSLSGFGTTSQMFDAAYWRAKEGELARTIVASPHIAFARVHIATSGSSPFRRGVEPTASVSVTPAGAPVSPAQANALRFLISSAVAGLSAEDVAVIDGNGTLIGPSDPNAATDTAESRAQILRERVLRLVEARVGPGNAVVEVSVDTVTDTESIRERRIDPQGRVAVSTDIEERSDSSQNQAAGDVTIASNLPDGDAATPDGSHAQTSESRERVNYELSQTEHEIRRGPGAVKRLTVAVLVNGLSESDSSGTVPFQQRPEEELAALRDLVASAVGFDEERGDVITLKSMDLPAAVPQGTAAGSSFMNRLALDVTSLIQIFTLGAVMLILGLFVVRPILARPLHPVPSAPHLPPARLSATPDPVGPALTGEIEDGDPDHFMPEPPATGASVSRHTGGIPALSERRENPVDRLRAMIGERQEETVEILRSWLEDSGENA